MAVEYLSPPGGSPQIQEGVGYRSPIFVLPDPPVPHVFFEEVKREIVDFEYPLQRRVEKELLPLLGKDFTNSDALQAFDQRAAVFGDLIRKLSPDERNGQMDATTRKLVERRGSCLRIATTVLATRLGYDLYGSMHAKLIERMSDKYHPALATEIRLYGPEPTDDNPNPEPLNGFQVLGYLKKGWDEVAKAQTLRVRGLFIPPAEQAARIPSRKYPNELQELANVWQVSALGSDLIPEDRIANVIAPEIGETDEVMREFERISDEEVDLLSPYNPDHDQVIADIGAELTDVMIGLDCYFAAIGTDVDKADKAAMDQAKKTFADGPDLEVQGVGFKERMRYMEERARRILAGHALPFPPVPKPAEAVPVYASSSINRRRFH